MDFFQIAVKETKKGGPLQVHPDFIVGRSKDLMVRGGKFYAVWDEEAGLWSTEEIDVQRLVDQELRKFAEENGIEQIKSMRSFGSNSWNQFKKYVTLMPDNSKQLDETLTFANTEVKKNDYVSRRLPYSLTPGDHSAWDELIGQLYSPEERDKIEWAIGAVISGDSKKIQKFLVLYGPPGHGKGTVIDVLLKLFEGYTTTFDAKELTKGNNQFATEKFKNNPLVAIQHDGDLSRIEDNTKLNSIISHEWMSINAKYKSPHDAKIHAFLFMGTNSEVKISDAKSGLIRRLIDVHPSGNLFSPNDYRQLVDRIDFELGGIAHYCLERYRKMGKNYYSDYRPLQMMYKTDIFFNYVEAHFDVFKAQNGVSLRQAYTLYKEYCNDTGIERMLPMYQVREQLKNYFDEFHDKFKVEGRELRSYYYGFSAEKFKAPIRSTVGEDPVFSLVMEETTSIFDLECANQPAQGFKEDESGRKIPSRSWSQVKTSLAEIDTSDLHFVKIPENHIVIDFDLKDENGEKSLELNLQAASVWPATYAEISQGGNGVHLHYIYEGDVYKLANNYAEGIEVKTLLGDASLRRRLTKCNNVPVATISSGLPFKEKKPVLDQKTIKSEKGLRDLIARNLRKEIHPSTKSSIDFIHKILEDAYFSGMEYDVSDLQPKIIAFANNSTNQPLPCLRVVHRMKFKSDIPNKVNEVFEPKTAKESDRRNVFFDVEVYPNLFLICWKYEGEDKIIAMVNPTQQEVEELFSLKLIGFNNRRYDNHILYAAFLGYTVEQLYKLSKKIVDGVRDALFSGAYKLSYADIYDFASVKMSLKKWQIELGIPHKEMDHPWDEPVPEEKLQEVIDYCSNDVRSNEAVFHARKQDFVARQILAELSGLTVNDTTAKHTAAIIFEGDRNPQRSFNYTDLSKEFPGYEYSFGKSSYREEDPSEGGYVYSEPGMYEDVVVLDVASMHPSSIIQLDLFGKYTKNFDDLLKARLAIKHANIAEEKGNSELAEQHLNEARQMLRGQLAPYLDDHKTLEALQYALKIVINIVYGLTSAKFDNPFRDIRNKDNIVAKRGALFMIDLKHFVQEAGFQVVHIKTDSIKIPGAPDWLIDQIVEFGAKYGYEFEHEATYSKMCLVNDAVYIAKYGWAEKKKLIGTWVAVGAQFQHPYIFKTLFSGEEVNFYDMCETKSVVKGALHLDFTSMATPEYPFEGLHFIGKTGRFVPVNEGCGGGTLWRIVDEKAYRAAGSKGYLWVEDIVGMDLPDEAIDISYFERLADEAKNTIEKFGSFEEFVK